jgi:hypothetical protein
VLVDGVDVAGIVTGALIVLPQLGQNMAPTGTSFPQ